MFGKKKKKKHVISFLAFFSKTTVKNWIVIIEMEEVISMKEDRGVKNDLYNPKCNLSRLATRSKFFLPSHKNTNYLTPSYMQDRL